MLLTIARKIDDATRFAELLVREGPGGILAMLEHAALVQRMAADDMRSDGPHLVGTIQGLCNQLEMDVPFEAKMRGEDLLSTATAVRGQAEELQARIPRRAISS